MEETNDILIRFGERVRKLRNSLALSQEAFADKCGLDRTYISSVERGKRNVSLRNLEVIARTFGISLAKLFRGV